jgi:hypothetical protein
MDEPVTDAAQRVKLTVTGECGHVLWTGFDVIEEKYPFWCEECDDMRREGRYPWKLASEIVAVGLAPAEDSGRLIILHEPIEVTLSYTSQSK